jgi:hypothetical protein
LLEYVVGIVKRCKHGVQGINLICSHISEDLDSEKIGVTKRLCICFGHALICPSCMNLGEVQNFNIFVEINKICDQDLLEVESDLIEDCLERFEKVESLIKLVPKCPVCIDEIRIKQARRSGHPDLPLKKAVEFRLGNYRTPLRIRIYYVREKLEQNKIIEIINERLQKEPMNQVQIEFFEAENWQFWNDPETGSSGRKHLEEKLLY